MARSGRPRANLEEKILEEMAAREKQAEEIVAQKINFNTPSIMAFEAACLRQVLEKGTEFEIARCDPLIKKLRQTNWALANDPRNELPDRKFLECFIEAHAPDWDWREDARQGEIEDRDYRRENERIAKEIAEDARLGMAHATKFYTPDAPDGVRLCALTWEYRKQRRFIRRTLPTLRELKLATAIPERTLQKIIKSLRPKKGEITKLPLRSKFRGRGSLPLRYGPRLIVGVLNEFLNRLPEFRIDDQERKQLRKTALLVKRAFVARLNASRRST